MQDFKKGDFIIYEDENEKIEIEAFLYDETIWLPLNKIAELFEKDKSVISRHISNIFEEQELTVDSTVANFATVQIEGNRKVNRNGSIILVGVFKYSSFFCCKKIAFI